MPNFRVVWRLELLLFRVLACDRSPLIVKMCHVCILEMFIRFLLFGIIRAGGITYFFGLLFGHCLPSVEPFICLVRDW